VTAEPHLFTIGHSTRSAEEFVALLRARGVESLVDVRSFPGSRRHPQFGKEALRATLAAAGIGYIHMVSLGGRRSRQDTPEHDTRWRNPAFANYADYARTEPFRAALTELEALARREPVAIMCAESLWWRCHRRIIAEELMKDGFAVTHIMSPGADQAGRLEPELPL
jgi:uncharacterized protein (DUF488 family)